MSQPFLTVSAMGLSSAGVSLSAEEAVACVVLVGDALQWRDATDPSHVVLRSDGRVDVMPSSVPTGGGVESYARLLHKLLPDSAVAASARVPGALRLAVARGIGALDAPPFSSAREFRTAIARFLNHRPEELIVGVVVRWAEAMASRPDERLRERRVAGPRVDVLRRMLRESDLERFALISGQAPGRVDEPAIHAASAAPSSVREPVSVRGSLPARVEDDRAERAEIAWTPTLLGTRAAREPRFRWRSVLGAAALASVVGWAGAMALRDYAPRDEPPRAASASAPRATATSGAERPAGIDTATPADARVVPSGGTSTPDERAMDATLGISGGFQLANVVDGSHRAENVSLSPDGSRVAFDSDRGGVRGVYVADRDGTGVRRVSGPGFAAGPAWTPDGRRLAILRGEERLPQVLNLWVLDLEAGEERRLTEYRYGEMSPAAWFPDGRRLGYARDDAVYVMDTESGASRSYESPIPGRTIPAVAASPDGRHIAFQVSNDGVWLLDLRDGSVRRVLDDPTVERLAWSPTGRSVAYHSGRDGRWGVWVMGE
jgi:hypothetical protein